MNHSQVAELLKLIPLEKEGGFFRQTFKSKLHVELANRTNTAYTRSATTAIYYLITDDNFSTLHRVIHDEIFHFYLGDAVDMIQIDPKGNLSQFNLGNDIFNSQQPQIVVPAHNWQGLKLKSGGKFALMGATVSPGFEYEDFEVGDRKKLVAEFPQHSELIKKYTK